MSAHIAFPQTGLPTGCTPPPFLEVARSEALTRAPFEPVGDAARRAPFLKFQVRAGEAGSWRLTQLAGFRAWQGEVERRSSSAGPVWFAQHRPELSYRADVDLSGMRYMMAALIKVNPGHAADFAEMRRLDAASHVAATADENRALCEVVAGGAATSYLMLTPMRSLAYEDDVPPLLLAKIRKALGAEGRERLQECHRLAIAQIQTTLLRVRPEASESPAAWRAGQPAFWTR